MSHIHHKKAGSARGFTLVEVIVAISILTVGLLSLAALMGKMLLMSHQSRFTSTETVLGSEKLEDLNRRSARSIPDPAIWAPDGGTAGSLTADVSQTVPTGQAVDYFDQVQVSAGNGSMQETIIGKDSAGKTQYTTVEHFPDGTAKSTQSPTAPAAANNDMLVFNRRWVIEKDPAGLPPGVRRITVVVSMKNNFTQQTPFQTSLVRP